MFIAFNAFLRRLGNWCIAVTLAPVGSTVTMSRHEDMGRTYIHLTHTTKNNGVERTHIDKMGLPKHV